MGLTEEERKSVVDYRLKKAKETFAEVAVQMENNLFRTAANRLYYACYYATTALLVKDCHDAHTHSGVKTLLGLHYVNSNKIEKSLAKMYGLLFNLRQSSDYEDWITIDEEDIQPFLEPAAKFIAEIENLLKN